ncbi:MAG: pilus assembly protein PilM [Candidatus Omnitrophica bacterium]|nr:pilus assembly protein PilM [Candidatus Omnitrophota bacterium]
MRRIVVELTRTSLRLLDAEVTARGLRVRQLKIEPLQGEAAPELLQRLLQGTRTSHAQALLVLPREQTFTRTVTLPSDDPDELTEMVRLSEKTQFPSPTDRLVMDFQVIRKAEGRSAVQMVACQRDLVERQLTLMRRTGLEPQALIPSAWALAAWYRWVGRSLRLSEPVMVMNVDRDRTDLALILDGHVVGSRSLGHGEAEWASGQVTDRLGQELDQTLAGLGRELPGMDLRAIVLTGVGPLETWRESLTKRFALPVVIRRQDGCGVPQPDGMPPVSLAVLFGLLVGDPGRAVNLLPPEVRQAQRAQRRLRDLAVTGSLAIAGLSLCLGALSAAISRQQRIQAVVAQRLQEQQPRATWVAHRQGDLRALEELWAARRRTAAALAGLLGAAPEGMRFQHVSVDRARRDEAMIRGHTATLADLFGYMRQVERLGLWRSVTLRSATPRQTPAHALVEFELMLQGN